MRDSGTAYNYLRDNAVVAMTDRAYLEMNMNRYATIASYTPTDYESFYGTDARSAGYYRDKFPIEHIAYPNRPKAGIVKMRFGSYPTLSWKSANGIRIINSDTATYDMVPDYWVPKPRYYMAGANDKYKYFMSALKTPSVFVKYTGPVATNKIRVVFEDTIDYPLTYKIQVQTTSGGAWTDIATTPVALSPGDGGIVNLYRVSGSWTATEPVSPGIADATLIYGIRVVPLTMNSSSAHLSIIEIAPCLRVDITEWLQEWNANEEISDNDAVMVIGKASANDGSITLSNTGNDWEARTINPAVPSLSMLARKYSEITVITTISGVDVKSLSGFCDEWKTEEGDTASTDVFDMAIILQAEESPEIVATNVTPSTAAIRLLDAAGFNNVVVHKNSFDTEPRIDYFYTMKDQTVWEALQDILYSHQYSAFFDSSGLLHIASNRWMFNRDDVSPWWTFLGQKYTGPDIWPDIVSHRETEEPSINKAVVTFTPVGVSKSTDPGKSLGPNVVANNRIATRILFTPERGVLLGATLLAQSMNSTQTSCYILNSSVTDSNWGAFSGYFMIDQEIIKFDGLEYSSSAGLTVVKSANDLSEVYSRAVGKVTFTGKLCNLERGQFGTIAASHGFDKATWGIPSSQQKYVSIKTDAGKRNRYIGIHNTAASASGRTTAFKNPGVTTNTYRTRMKILKAGAQARAGLIVSASRSTPSNNIVTGGYIVTINALPGTTTSELAIQQLVGGSITKTIIGQANIDYNVWENITVTTRMNSGGYDYIYLKGDNFSLQGKFPAKQIFYSSAVALVAIGQTNAIYDWVATGNGDIEAEETQNDAISHVLSENMGLLKKSPGYLENFGDTVSEIYVEDVRFSRGPALTINMYPCVNAAVSNKEGAAQVAKTGDLAWSYNRPGPWSARVVVANTSGESKLLDNLDSGLYPMLYGNIVEEFQSIEVTKTDQASIIQRGENKIEVQSKWINDRATAEDLADWLIERGRVVKVHELEVFDNPLIEIGDLVEIDYQARGLDWTTNMVVRSVSRSRSGDGISTSVVLVEV